MLPISDITVTLYWSRIINLIISVYFDEGSTTCILWNKQIEFQLTESNANQFISIWNGNLNESLANDFYNFTQKEEELQQKNLYYDELIMKLTVAIEVSQCEDIPALSSAFRKASSYSIWRSQRSKFLFCYRRDLADEHATKYFDDLLFTEQPHILVVEAEATEPDFFLLKTNKFVGSKKDKPAQLKVINTFNATTQSFEYPYESLYPDKLKNLKGREILVAAFDYRPYVAYDYEKQPQTIDRALDNPRGSVYVDGTEIRVLKAFCELYNCTIEVDSTEKSEFGDIFDNGTGFGLEGMVISRQVDIALDALYIWKTPHVDTTMFLSRSGVTCLVPRPQRLTSWIMPLKPFQATLWLGVFICLFLETCALLVTYHAELKLVLGDDDTNWAKSTRFGYMTTIKIFLSQAPDIHVVSLSVRTVLFSSFMIDIILTSIYGGGLSSILTLPTFAEAPDSVERLHKFGIPWTGSSMDWIFGLEKTDQPLIKDLVDMFRVYTLEETRELAKTENMGFVIERMTFGHFANINFLTQESLDRLKLMVNDIYFQYCVGLVPRLWAFLPKLNELIMNWHSSGMEKFWEWRIAADFLNGNMQIQIETSKAITLDGGAVKLDMSNFIGIIIIWSFGIAFSTLAFWGEIIYSRHHKKIKAQRLMSIEERRKWNEII